MSNNDNLNQNQQAAGSAIEKPEQASPSAPDENDKPEQAPPSAPAEAGGESMEQKPITLIEMSHAGEEQVKYLFSKPEKGIKRIASAIAPYASIITCLASIVGFFISCNTLYSIINNQIKYQTNDQMSIIINDSSSKGYVQYTDITPTSEQKASGRTSAAWGYTGELEIMIPFKLVNLSNHTIDVNFVEVTRIKDDNEYVCRCELKGEEDTDLEVPFYIAEGTSLTVNLHITSTFRGKENLSINLLDEKLTSNKQKLTALDLFQLYEEHNYSFPVYEIKFVTGNDKTIQRKVYINESLIEIFETNDPEIQTN